MPYVPSEKTFPPAEDRKILDPVINDVARYAANKITENSLVISVYKQIFVYIADELSLRLNCRNGAIDFGYEPLLAKTIFEVAEKYGYWGAHLGELNYAITRFIQKVPKIMLESGRWKSELKYWYYASVVSALRQAADKTAMFNIGVDGVFIDIKDEYKWRVNRSYETAQILKNGDCYDAPYYNKLAELVIEEDENYKHVGYIYVDLERSEETLHVDLLDYYLVLKKRPKGAKRVKN